MAPSEPVPFGPVAELDVDDECRVFEHGWQSFAPTTAYRIGSAPHRPVSERNRVLNYRGSSHPGRDVFFGEGLLAIDNGSAVHVVAAEQPFTTGVRLRAERSGSSLDVVADGPVTVTAFERGCSESDPIQAALGGWARAAAEAHGVPEPKRAPTGWCSWYQYFGNLTEGDVLENLEAIDEFGLDIDVLQLDDGYEAEIGDWLTPADGFADLRKLVDRIRDSGRRAGIWVAPFFVGARSRLADEHPEWLLRHPHGGALHAGHNWGQDLYSLDLTHPGAAASMQELFSRFSAWGIDYFKIDFLAAGAMDGRRYADIDSVQAYRRGLRLIRESVGPDAHILGCGAPVLPSVGLVDSLRVSADTDLSFEPGDGDLSSPGQRGAILSARGRHFMNGVFFVNDPDCLIVRPEVENRERWARHVADIGGAVVSSDRLRLLDSWGIETTRALLSAARRA